MFKSIPYAFVNEIRDDAVPSAYIKPIEQGVLFAMEMGILRGFPVVDVKVTLCDGSYHQADSNEMAFKFAGATAFKGAAKKASPALLEPMMAIEVEVPEELTTAIQREIGAHRGRIESKLTANGFGEINAVVPLSELLASSSGGLAELPMEFAGYEAVRDNGFSDENGSGMTANKPNDPRPRNRSATARWAADEEE